MIIARAPHYQSRLLIGGGRNLNFFGQYFQSLTEDNRLPVTAPKPVAAKLTESVSCFSLLAVVTSIRTSPAAGMRC